MIEFIDKNYRNFLIVFSAACLAIVAISYLEAGHFNSNFAWLLLGILFIPVGVLCWKRSAFEQRTTKWAWMGISVFYLTRAAYVIPSYPEAAVPTTIGVAYMFAGLILISVIALTSEYIQSLSRTRVFLDSAWISICLIISCWFLFLKDMQADLDDPLERVGTQLALVVVASITGLLINLGFQTTGKGITGPILVGITFAGLSLAAFDDIIGFATGNYEQAIDIMWMLIDIPLVAAAVTKSEIIPKGLLTQQKRNHVTALTVAPLLAGIAILFVTAPSEIFGVVAVGSTVACMLALRVSVISSENSRLSAELQKLALTDDLTGLPNRRALEVDIGKLVEAEDPLVIYVDLDYFKEVNDEYGHQAGDELLRTFARRVTDHLRADDKCYRVGGDEFVVVIDRGEILQEGAVNNILQRLRSSVETEFELTAGKATIDMSVGVARGTHGGQELLQAADKAMFKAKAEGRATVAFAEVL